MMIHLNIGDLRIKSFVPDFLMLRIAYSVTRLGDLLEFRQLFKAFGNNLICPNLPHS